MQLVPSKVFVYTQKATNYTYYAYYLGVVCLDLRHTWGQYCHPSNTAQSAFMIETKARG